MLPNTNFSITYPTLQLMDRLDHFHGKAMPSKILAKSTSRILGIFLASGANFIDIGVHALTLAGKTLRGIVVSPYNFTVKHFKPTLVIAHEYEFSAAMEHVPVLITKLFHVAILPFVTLISPKFAASLFEKSSEQDFERLSKYDISSILASDNFDSKLILFLKANEALNKELRQLRRSLTIITHREYELGEKYKKLQETHSQCKDEKELKDDVQSLKTLLQDRHSKIEELERIICNLDAEKTRYTSQLWSEIKAKKELEDSLDILQTKLETVQQENDHLKNKLESFSSKKPTKSKKDKFNTLRRSQCVEFKKALKSSDALLEDPLPADGEVEKEHSASAVNQ